MVVNITPIEQMVFETDAPYLSPIYGTKNESSNILITVKEISKIKNIKEKAVQEQLLNNTKRILKI
jgi:TatD DNase family protein